MLSFLEDFQAEISVMTDVEDGCTTARTRSVLYLV